MTDVASVSAQPGGSGAPAPGGPATPVVPSSPGDPAGPGSAGPRAVLPRRRPGHLGPLGLTRILLCEAAVVAAGYVATRGVLPGVLAGVAALGVLAVALGRRRGRWWLEHLVIARSHRRRRAAAPDTGAGPALGALRTLAPGLAVHDVSAPDGARVGVARDQTGWYAVVALAPTAPVHPEAAPIPVDAVVGVLAETDQPGVVLQIVTHTVPAPGLEAHPSAPAGASYRQLLGAFGPPAVPAHRETWVAVRVDAHDLAEAVLDTTAGPVTAAGPATAASFANAASSANATGLAPAPAPATATGPATDRDAAAGLDAAAALTASLSRRVATSLRRLGIDCRVLDSTGLLDALARSCDLEPSALDDPRRVREEWTHWHSARLAHRTYWLRQWPPTAARLAPLLDWLATTPAALTTVSLTLVPGERDEVSLRGLVRLAAPADELTPLCTLVADGVRQAGGEVFPLDGEHGPAAYATAPTGGGAG